MILNKALSKNNENLFEIDMHVIRQMAQGFDDGMVTDETIMAKFIVAAFEAGFDAGVEECEETHRNMALLMMCTGGNA